MVAMATAFTVAVASSREAGIELSSRFYSFSSSLPVPRKCRLWRQNETISSLSPYIHHKPLQRTGVPTLCLPASAPILTPLSDLYDFICSGPLLSKAGLDPNAVKDSLDEWLELGLRLSRNLGFNELFLTPEEKIRVYHYYIPVFMWCKQQLAHHQAQFKEGEDVPALVMGITAPQGCGKSTLVYSLDYLFNSLGSRAVSVSIDDFYLTGQDQEKLAAENPGNSLLELRGNAGSHDLKLGMQTLEALRHLSSPGRKAKVPRYDKSARSGRGDRADPSLWPEIEGPLKILLFEGWMLGFVPVAASAYQAIDPQLEKVNRNLAAYHDAWDKYVDSWIVIKVSNLEAIYKWRLQAEIGMRMTGRPGMTDEEVKDFVSRYMPAYKAYLPGLYASGPTDALPGRTLQLDIDDNRNPIG
ncbi:hypothetical protein GOP47_0011768 [Adiantum capillus-veneris]|uniref:Phosphoribulokinase/uridine kinase domain-containing protein n=1 Tax=Adiantum capillus-veneris TaxID=13818 RepID=A0A9D4UTD1_ADICA|nr:hypothetical protein GOP47_0011768 [Adiantum capillus-veneris]